MSTSIGQPVSFDDVLRNKVRSVLFDAIPEDALNKMIEQAWKAYFVPRPSTGYGAPNRASIFEEQVTAIITKAMDERLTAKVNEYLAAAEDPTSEVFRRVAGDVWKGVQERMVADVIEGMRTRM